MALGATSKELGDHISVDELICRSNDLNDLVIQADLRMDNKYFIDDNRRFAARAAIHGHPRSGYRIYELS